MRFQLERMGLVALALLAISCKRGRVPRGSRDPEPAPVTTGQSARPRFSTAHGGGGVYDAERDVTWLANFNLPATRPLGVDGVKPSGAMTYKQALAWIEALNRTSYLGRSDWQLPTSPARDATCDRKNRYNFGWGCKASALGSLYAGLGLQHPATAVPIPLSTAALKGFINFQPYLYWSESPNANHPENENGYTTFSFANGFQGSNVARNFIYVLPMVDGRFVPASPADRSRVVNDGDVTWLADANVAATQTFGVPGIAPTGAMTHEQAEKLVAAMNASNGGKGYLGTNRWRLPPTAKLDDACSSKETFGFDCTGSPLGRLYYKVLGLSRGQPVVKAPDTRVGPFQGIEPYLYWSCHEAEDGRGCSARREDPVAGFGWSFSFGNGFQGTTTRDNLLFVTAYHPGK